MSEDGLNWITAAEIPELFPPPAAPKPRTKAAASTADQPATPTTASNDQTNQNSTDDGSWFYSRDEEKLGPVTAIDIQNWLTSGQLSPQDLVWNPSLDDWIRAGDLPQFAAVVLAADEKRRLQSKATTPQRSSRSRKKASLIEIIFGWSRSSRIPDAAFEKFPNLTRYISLIQILLRVFFAIGVLVSSGLSLLAVIGGIQAEESVIIAIGLAQLIIQPLVLWLIFFTLMAMTEVIMLLLRIEDNTSLGE